MAEPAAKKARTEEAGALEEGEEMAVEETSANSEREEDAQPDKSPKIQDDVVFHTQDTTMNVMQAEYGNMLVPLTEGGLQYLLAGARASAGVTSGRYAFEVRVVEQLSPAQEGQAKAKTPQPPQQLRVGFSAAGASTLFVGETDESVCFDMDGALVHDKKKTRACAKLPFVGSVLAVVLNLDSSSTNAHTISLFRDGKRATPPQPLPESLKGKTLFPALTFRNMTVHYNFGPLSIDLPFTCLSIQEAATKDAVVNPAPKSSQFEVMFPVCLPEEGTFDWLDMFLEKNPQYTELSDRAVLNWCQKSGIVRSKGYEARMCNDKIDFAFGVPSLDDGSIRRTLMSIAPIQKRNYVVMEVKANLVQDDRKAMLALWAGSSFRKVAEVMVGEPPASFKSQVQEVLLQEKQKVVDAEFKKKQDEELRKRQMKKKAKELERAKAKNLKIQKKKAEAAKKKLEIDKKKREAAAKGEEYEEEELEQKEESEEEPEPMEEEAPMEESPPKAELSDEEKKVCFRKGVAPDITSYVLNTSFTKFSAPVESEGFDEVRYNWLKKDKAQQHLKSWISERKNTTRVEDLKPGDWFAGKMKEWQKTLVGWHAKQNAYKTAVTKKAADKAARKAKAAAMKQARERAAALKKEAEERKAIEAAAKGGLSLEDAKDEADKQENEKVEDEPMEEEEKEESTAGFDKLDVYGVEDILDVSNGQPLFGNFGFEDWAMMGLRVELTLIAHAFTRDSGDDDRQGIHLDHLAFYYQKYFKKALNFKFFGVENMNDLLNLVRETVVIRRQGKVVDPQVPDDIESFSIFAMLTEEARRDRNRRVDLGDDGAKLKVQAAQAHGVAPTSALRPVGPAVAHAAAHAAAASQHFGAVGPVAMAPVKPVMMQQAISPISPIAPLGQAISPIAPVGKATSPIAPIKPLMAKAIAPIKPVAPQQAMIRPLANWAQKW